MFTAAAILAAAWGLAVYVNRRGVSRYDGSGDAGCGIVIFVEPVRWLFIVWGFNAVCRAVRRAGGGHAIRLFGWSRAAGSLFVLPDLMRRSRLDVKAARLARYMERLAREHPGSLIHLIGYSTGAYVAFEAVRRLAPEVPVGRVIALHGTVSPDYPLEAVAGRALGIVNVYGRLDCLINGLAPLLFGTNDRVHTLACGMVGLRCSAVNVEQRAWRLRDARLGYLGGHFTAVSGAWLRRYIVPRLV